MLLRALANISVLPSDLDVELIAEEIEDLGRAQIQAAASLIRNILVHAIKLVSEPDAQAAAHWRTELVAFHASLTDVYQPSMRQRIDMEKVWRQALAIADASLAEHGGQVSTALPGTCPVSISDIADEGLMPARLLAALR